MLNSVTNIGGPDQGGVESPGVEGKVGKPILEDGHEEGLHVGEGIVKGYGTLFLVVLGHVDDVGHILEHADDAVVVDELAVGEDHLGQVEHGLDPHQDLVQVLHLDTSLLHEVVVHLVGQLQDGGDVLRTLTLSVGGWDFLGGNSSDAAHHYEGY